MKNQNSKIIVVLIFSVMILTSASPALGALTSVPSINKNSDNKSGVVTSDRGENNSGENGNQNGEILRERIKNKSNQEIERRINALNKANTRLQSMERISEETKAQLGETIQNQISEMNLLKDSIENEEDLEQLIEYKGSINKAYRIYALVIPQGAVIAATDRIMTITSSMETIVEKLETRIEAEKEKGADTQNMEGLLAEIKSEIESAKTSTQEAIDMVSDLVPDEGDEEELKSNIETLKEARDKVKSAQQQLINAKQNAREIINELKRLNKITEPETEE